MAAPVPATGIGLEAGSRPLEGYAKETVDGSTTANVAEGISQAGPLTLGGSDGNVVFCLESILQELRYMNALLECMRKPGSPAMNPALRLQA